MTTDTQKPIKIKANLFWAQAMHTPSTMSGKYEVTLANLSEKAVEALETLNLTVRSRADKPEQGFFIVCKSAKFPIQAYDVNNKEISPEIQIGNGTEAVAILSAFSWKSPTGKKGTSASLKKLTVTKLIEYGQEAAEEEFDDVL